MITRTTLAAVAMIFAGMSVAYPQEKRISRNELPSKVQKTVDQESKGGIVRSFSTRMEQGSKVYVVELVVNGHTRDISMDANGQILEVAEETSMDSLPVAVQRSLAARAANGTIETIESLLKRGIVVAYKAAVSSGAKSTQIEVAPDGSAFR